MLSSHLFTVYYTNRARVLVTFLFRLFLWIHALEKTLGKDIKKHIYIQEWLVMISFKSISQFLQCGTTKRFLFLLGKISVHCGVTPKYNSTITLLYPQPGLELRLLDPESTTLSMRPPPLSHSNNNYSKVFFTVYLSPWLQLKKKTELQG